MEWRQVGAPRQVGAWWRRDGNHACFAAGDTISLPTTSDWPARSCQGDFRRHSFVWGQHSAARFCTPVQIEGRGLMGVRVVEEERLFVTRYSVSAPVISAYAVNQLIMLIKPAAFAAREES